MGKSLQTFSYEALDAGGQHAEGRLTAANRREALERLLRRGLHVLELREQAAQKAAFSVVSLFRRRRLRLATMTRQLATLSGSGVPLMQSMNVLIEQTDDAKAKAILSDILETVKAGQSLSDALEKHRDVFPEVMVSMVHMGEVSGTLDEVLARLAELFEKQEEIRGEVKAALAYPALVLLLGLASAAALVAFIIPRLATMFEGLGQRLPLPTRILVKVSGVMSGYWWAFVLGIAAAAFAFRAVARRPAFRVLMDRLKLRIPVAGKLIRQAAVGRFARALGALAHSEVPIVEALHVARAAVGNAAIAGAIGQMVQRVQAGESLAALMKSSGVFPPLPVQMVAVGEETGHLDEMLLRVAEAYDRETAASTKIMTSLLAPALILCVAVVVAFIILSMVLPIFQISAGIR